MPLLEQIVGGGHRRGHIIQRHGVHRIFARARPGKHHGKLIGQVVETAVRIRIDHHDALGLAAGHQLLDEGGKNGFVGGGGGEQKEAMLPCFLFGTLDDAGEGVVGEVGGDAGEDAGSPFGHGASDGAGAVAQALDGSFYFGACFGTHALIVVDHA